MSACVALAAWAQVPGEFSINELDEVPRPKRQVAPVYPYNMRAAGLVGRVTIEFVVNYEGRVVAAQVVRSNNPYFERPALDAVMKWTFTPGKKAGRPVNTRCQIDIPFMLDGAGQNLWQIGKGKNHASLPPALQWDIAPEPLNTAYPVYPFEDLMKGTTGKTRIGFVVGLDGRVMGAKVQEATTPAMGMAALAAIDAWEFQPARKADGSPAGAQLGLEHEFSTRSGDVPVSESALAIVRALKKGAPIATLKELDARLRPLMQRPPVYPSPLRESGQNGEADIEFFIDENGDAQLPRIVSASAPEFGYAAAQAVAAWRFTVPTKGGKPVVVRAQIPVRFTLKSEAPAAKK